MSQLNVDTLGGQTGTTISIASGHILSGVGGLAGAQQFRLTATITTTGFNDITSNLEVPDTENQGNLGSLVTNCLLYTSPSPRDKRQSRMPSSA